MHVRGPALQALQPAQQQEIVRAKATSIRSEKPKSKVAVVFLSFINVSETEIALLNGQSVCLVLRTPQYTKMQLRSEFTSFPKTIAYSLPLPGMGTPKCSSEGRGIWTMASHVISKRTNSIISIILQDNI